MSKKINIFDDVMSLSRPCGGRIKEIQSSFGGTYLLGEVLTPNGIVSIQAQGDKDSFYFSRLDFCYKGKLFMRNYNGKRYSPQYLTTLANRFTKEIVKKINEK